MAAEQSESAAMGVDFDVTDYDCVDFTNLNLDVSQYTQIHTAVQLHFRSQAKAFQVSAIADVIKGEKDVFVIAEIISGKSVLDLVVPAVKESTIWLVICPMLALMSDQVGIIWPMQSQH